MRYSYKVVWYVYYNDPETDEKYPAFCIEPKKEGVGTGYDSYSASVSRENNNQIWRILNKGYMGKSYQIWNEENQNEQLKEECEDDFYSGTKIE